MVESIKKPVLASTGTCTLCGSSFSNAAIIEHISECRSKKDLEKKKSFHLMVQDRYSDEYWLHLEVSHDAKLKALDNFLRDIWLECCGHLSAFTIGKKHYDSDGGMGVKLGAVLRPALRFYYEYDFGSTTELTLEVLASREDKIKGGPVLLLARNEPLRFNCVSCGKPATLLCPECSCSGEAWLCPKCARIHECGEEMLMPIVNSPRMGVCGYEG